MKGARAGILSKGWGEVWGVGSKGSRKPADRRLESVSLSAEQESVKVAIKDYGEYLRVR